jgi:hypothetical protein
VLVDETGKVLSAKAIFGPELRDAAVKAAMRAKFKPTIVGGAPVKVSEYLLTILWRRSFAGRAESLVTPNSRMIVF